MYLSGTPPFGGKSNNDILQSIQNGKLVFESDVFSHYSKEAIDFIQWCLSREVSQRPTAIEAQSHAWFKVLHSTNHHQSAITSTVKARLQNFQKKSTFSKIIMEVVSHSLSQEQIHELTEEFLRFDTDNSGDITLEEFKSVLRADDSGMSVEEIDELFHQLDFDHTGSINYHEFVAGAITKQEV